METHREEAVAWASVVMLLGFVGCLATFDWRAAAWAFGLAVLMSLNLSAYTLRADRTEVSAWLGVGLLRRRVSLRDVHAFWVVRQPWLIRVGVPLWPARPWWGRVGSFALEFQLQSGRVICIPTGDPAGLRRAVLQGRPGLTQLEDRDHRW